MKRPIYLLDRDPLDTVKTTPEISRSSHENYFTNKRWRTTIANAGWYVLSGCSQPILMTFAKDSGLGNSYAQVYMFFYALGPALVLIPLFKDRSQWPSRLVIGKAVGIALFDVLATCINYIGASMAGPTIFSIVYSSVTVWTALYSQLILGRKMNMAQWLAVFSVFGGLTLTATDSLKFGDSVVQGLFLVMFGSAMHALTYVASEIVMAVGTDKLSVEQNCAVQACSASVVLLVWQVVYTLPRFQETLGDPMKRAGTTLLQGFCILSLFAAANLVHSLTFYHTLLHFPGGATSAGLMKAIQAVLVFLFTHLLFCGQTGGNEMCFSQSKFLSLLTVVGGVVWYGAATQQQHQRNKNKSFSRQSVREYVFQNPNLHSGELLV